MFLRNSWYVAAWDHEIARKPARKTILGDKVVLFRDPVGTVIALEDACPHRKLPLSMGRPEGEHIRCGYHGMLFDRHGHCVEIPGQERIPPSACVRSYPVIERWNWIWIWMGNPEKADPGEIIDIPHFGEQGWGVNRGPAMDVACHYQYMTDNLLDPSHVSYVHSTSLGNEATVGVPVETVVEGSRVIVTRWIENRVLAPFFAPRVKFKGLADRLQHYELRSPAMAVIKDIIAPAGSGAPGGHLHKDVFLLDSYNFVTPVDESNSRYFWFQVRNFDGDDALVSEQLTADFISAFSEDLVVLGAVQKGMAESSRHIDLAIDRGSNHARLLVQRLIREEQDAMTTDRI